MSSLVLHSLCLLASSLLVAGFPGIAELEPMYILISTLDPIFCIVFTVSSYFYVKRTINRLKPRIIGQNLAHKSMAEQFHFETPKFIDIGFTDLNKFGEFWRLKHKNFSFCAAQGMREYMEDRWHYMFDPNNALSIFGIFDGHGGQFVSEYLEKHFAKAIRSRMIRGEARRKLSNASNLSNDDHVVEMLFTEICRLDDRICEIDPKATWNTGSTLIAAMIERNRYLSVMNVGDSRAVACDIRGRTVSLSKDHKPSDKVERRRIESAGGFVHLDEETFRVQGILAVSRAIGDLALKRIGVITAHPDIVRIDLATKPLRFLIVATDGFWDVITDKEAIDLANKYLRSHSPSDWHRISIHLVQVALARRTQDNVSVLFIKLK